MSDEFQLQISSKDSDLWLTLSKTGSGLLARGRRDIATLAASARSETARPSSAMRRLAEGGDLHAQFELGEAYHKGLGLPQDYAEAVRWYRKAAEHLHLYAVEALGDMFESGHGVPVDLAEAFRWYRNAADIAYSDLTGRYSEWDPDYTIGTFHKAAEYGYPLAQYVVGALLAYGIFDRPPDYIQGHMWLSLAASGAVGDDQKRYSSDRDAIAARMTSEQLAEAQRLAQRWRSKLNPVKDNAMNLPIHMDDLEAFAAVLRTEGFDARTDLFNGQLGLTVGPRGLDAKRFPPEIKELFLPLWELNDLSNAILVNERRFLEIYEGRPIDWRVTGR